MNLKLLLTICASIVSANASSILSGSDNSLDRRGLTLAPLVQGAKKIKPNAAQVSDMVSNAGTNAAVRGGEVDQLLRSTYRSVQYRNNPVRGNKQQFTSDKSVVPGNTRIRQRPKQYRPTELTFRPSFSRQDGTRNLVKDKQQFTSDKSVVPGNTRTRQRLKQYRPTELTFRPSFSRQDGTRNLVEDIYVPPRLSRQDGSRNLNLQ